MLTLSYFLLSLAMILLTLYTIRMVQQKRGIKSTKAVQKALFIFFIWFNYLWMLSISGFLTELQLPPRIPLFLFFPFALFTFIFCRRAAKSQWINELPLTWLTYPQSFRIAVEFLLLFTFMKGIIPKEATFEGFNFDILMGISAPIMAFFVFSKPNVNLKLALSWNILGILMILFVAIIIATSFYNPSIWGQTKTMVSTQFLRFPYLLVAGFLAPFGIFMHALSIAKIAQLKRTKKAPF